MENETLRDEIKTIDPLNKEIERDESKSFAKKEIQAKAVSIYPDPKIKKDIKTKKSWFLTFLKVGFLTVSLLIAIAVIFELAKQNGMIK